LIHTVCPDPPSVAQRQVRLRSTVDLRVRANGRREEPDLGARPESTHRSGEIPGTTKPSPRRSRRGGHGQDSVRHSESLSAGGHVFDGTRLESTLPEMTGPAISATIATHMCRGQPVHPSARTDLQSVAAASCSQWTSGLAPIVRVWKAPETLRRGLRIGDLEAVSTTAGSNGESIDESDNLLDSHPKMCRLPSD
jgi:hypothetical protein